MRVHVCVHEQACGESECPHVFILSMLCMCSGMTAGDRCEHGLTVSTILQHSTFHDSLREWKQTSRLTG